MWESSPVSAGDIGRVEQYNNLRNDALKARFVDFTYGETIAVNDALYLKSDGKVYKAVASSDDEKIHNFIGFAKEAGVANDVKKVQISGVVSGFSGLTVGSYYYLSTTAGAITTTLPTYAKKIGIAVSTTELLTIKEIIPNFSILIAEPAQMTQVSTSSTTYVTVKEFRIRKTANMKYLRLIARIHAESGVYAFAQIKIATTTGSEVSTNSTSYVWLEGDLLDITNVANGIQELSIQIRQSAAWNCYLQGYTIMVLSE